MNEAEQSVLGAPLTVCIDFKNPHAFLANEPTWALAADLRLDPIWLPYIAAPLARPILEPASITEDRGTKHRRLRAAYADADLRRYAAVRGVTLVDPYRAPDSSAAGIALLWVNRQASSVQRRFVTGVFEAYWRGELDLEDTGALKSTIVEAGGSVSGFDVYLTGAGESELVNLQSRINDAGVFNVPAYLVGDEVFYGRAHLPMVRWLLTGRSGAPPI